MKSNHSVRKSTITPKSRVRKAVKLKASRRIAKSNQSVADSDPFSGLISPLSKCIPPLVQAIESHLQEQGLEPARCRSTKRAGVEYRFTTDGGITVSAEIVCTPEILSEPYFVIRAHLGTLSPRLRTSGVLESLLFLNLARNQRCRTGLRADGSVQVLFSARVQEEFDPFSLGGLFRETLDFATFVRGTFVGEDAFLSEVPGASDSNPARLH